MWPESLPGALDGLLGIDQEIEHRLAELGGKTDSHDAGRQVGFHFHIVVLEAGADDEYRLFHRLPHVEAGLFPIRPEEIAEVVNGVGHALQEAQGVAHRFVQIVGGELLVIVVVLDIADHQAQGIERLAPLVGNVMHHFPHGRQAGLLDEQVVLLPVPGQGFLDALLQAGVEFLQALFGSPSFGDFGFQPAVVFPDVLTHPGEAVDQQADFVPSSGGQGIVEMAVGQGLGGLGQVVEGTADGPVEHQGQADEAEQGGAQEGGHQLQFGPVKFSYQGGVADCDPQAPHRLAGQGQGFFMLFRPGIGAELGGGAGQRIEDPPAAIGQGQVRPFRVLGFQAGQGCRGCRPAGRRATRGSRVSARAFSSRWLRLRTVAICWLVILGSQRENR